MTADESTGTQDPAGVKDPTEGAGPEAAPTPPVESSPPASSGSAASAPRPAKRKRRKWPWVVPTVLIVILFLAWVGLNCYGAYWVAHGGYTGQSEPNVSSIGFPATDVSYGPNLVAWYAPAQGSNPVAVIVHGYQANRSHVLGTADALYQHGYGLMIPDLGYVSGKSDFGGGDREANQVREAVDYVHAHSTAPVVLIGYSEGAPESILAAERGAKVDAVVTDSGPVSFVSIAADRVHISQDFFAAASIVYPWFSGGGHLEDLAGILPGNYKVPTLVIQGTRDNTVPYADGPTLARLTHGQLWTVDGAGHDGAFALDPTGYISRVTTFIDAAIGAHG